MGKKKIGEFSNKPTPASGDLFLIQDVSTGIYYNVTKAQMLVIFGSGIPNLQQVTDTGSTTNNDIDFIGETDGFYKVRIGTDGTGSGDGNGSVQAYDDVGNSTVEIRGTNGIKVHNNAYSGSLFEVIRNDGVDIDKVKYKGDEIATLNYVDSMSLIPDDYDYVLMQSFRATYNY